MKVIRVAVDEELLKRLERIMQSEGFVSLAELVRYCIRKVTNELLTNKNKNGKKF